MDANIVVRSTIETPSTELAGYLAKWDKDEEIFVAPMLIRYEVTNALHRLLPIGASDEMVQHSLASFRSMQFVLITAFDLHQFALQIARKFKLAATYGAHYLAVALRYGVHFYTTDRKLFNSVGSELNWVHLVN